MDLLNPAIRVHLHNFQLDENVFNLYFLCTEGTRDLECGVFEVEQMQAIILYIHRSGIERCCMIHILVTKPEVED